MASKKSGKYIGDASVAKYLETYKSQTPFHVVRTRVLGALASPATDLLPVAVIASFWPEDQFPRFATKDEGETFFSTFMGLWRRMQKMAQADNPVLSARGKLTTLAEAQEALLRRCEEIEAGFIEGFWAGQDDLKMPSATAALIDGIGAEADSYFSLMNDVQGWSEYTDSMRNALIEELDERDRIVEDAMKTLLLIKGKTAENTH